MIGQSPLSPTAKTEQYTPTTEEIREYIEAADRATAHMVALDAPATVAAFDRWLASHDAQVQVEALRDAADRWHVENIGTAPRMHSWLLAEADRIIDKYRTGE